MTTFPISTFRYHKETQSFCVEISTLKGVGDGLFQLSSMKIKGRQETVDFLHFDTVRDGENDVTYWRFLGHAKDGKAYYLTVYND